MRVVSLVDGERPSEVSPRRVLWLIGAHISRHPLRVTIAFVCLIVTKLTNLALPIVMKLIVDNLSPGVAIVSSPTLLLALFGSLRVLSAVADKLHDYVSTRVIARLKRRLLLDAFTHMHELSMRFHLSLQVGAVVRDIERGADALIQWMRIGLFTLLPLIFEISAIAVILLWRFDWRFAAIAYGSVIAYVGFIVLISRWRMRMVRRTNEAHAAASSRALDSLLNFETVKACGCYSEEVRRYGKLLERCEDAVMSELSTANFLGAGHAMIIAASITAVLLLLIHRINSGYFTVGDVVLVNGLLFQLYTPLQQFGGIFSTLSQSRADLERTFSLLDTPQEVLDTSDAVELPDKPFIVAFRNVRFHYLEARPILHDISFEVSAGRTVAIVGHSGSGKSTIARLLLRFFDVSDGAVLVNGIDVRRLRQVSLRSAIGCVLQEGVLFNDTLTFNISYGSEGASENAIANAARGAGIHDLIMSLPRGYNTVVGERGLKLSAGEKQRVAIARALLRDPPMLLLDEATSALDTESERCIQQAVRRSGGRRATLVIAHRLSTIVDADEILVLEHGHIVERGRHRSLLQLDGRYARLWALQGAKPAESSASSAL